MLLFQNQEKRSAMKTSCVVLLINVVFDRIWIMVPGIAFSFGIGVSFLCYAFPYSSIKERSFYNLCCSSRTGFSTNNYLPSLHQMRLGKHGMCWSPVKIENSIIQTLMILHMCVTCWMTIKLIYYIPVPNYPCQRLTSLRSLKLCQEYACVLLAQMEAHRNCLVFHARVTEDLWPDLWPVKGQSS